MVRPAWLEVGYVARTHGVRGEIRVRLHNSMSTALDELSEVRLTGPGSLPARVLKVCSARAIGAHVALVLEGIEDRSGAEALVGAKVLVAGSALPALEDDEFYHFELIGLEAVNERGEPVGRLEEIIPTAADDVYVVRGQAGELMVPARTPYVGSIDLEAGRIRLACLEDLIVNDDAL